MTATKDRVAMVAAELDRMSREYGVSIHDMTNWLRRTYGIGTYGRVTDEQLAALEAKVQEWVGAAESESGHQDGGQMEIPIESEHTRPATRAVAIPTETAAVSRETAEERQRLLKGLILRDATDAQIELVLRICERYGFDPLLKHVVIVSGQLYVTRDGLLHLAHQTGMLDGIEVEAKRDETASGSQLRGCTGRT